MAKDTKLADIENKISSLVEKKRRIEEKQKDKILIKMKSADMVESIDIIETVTGVFVS